jgi:thioredoxin 1
MPRTAPLLLATSLIASLAAGCARSEASPPPAPVAAPAAAPVPLAAALPAHAAAKQRLIFFMNPNGRPCQMQDQILAGLGANLADKVDVVRYRTTSPAELAMFEAYGIRSLPQLVLADAEGRELRRATPGILGAEQVLALVGR